MTSTGYYQGEYAGPLTQRAIDYNGHEVIGVQISDEAPDGAVFFVTLDDHMQVSIAPVIAASITPYEPADPPAVPEIEPEDYEATRRSLEEIIARILSKSPQDTGELRTCAIAMSELANVIDAQTAAFALDENGYRINQTTKNEEYMPIKPVRIGAQAAQTTGASTCTEEVASACRASDGTEVQP